MTYQTVGRPPFKVKRSVIDTAMMTSDELMVWNRRRYRRRAAMVWIAWVSLMLCIAHCVTGCSDSSYDVVVPSIGGEEPAPPPGEEPGPACPPFGAKAQGRGPCR